MADESSGANAIGRVLADRPHAGLSVEPTPIHRLDGISSRLGRSVYILREDLTGFGIGGNKVRKLDYLIGDALRSGADTLVTTAASSFSRNAAAAATARGLTLHVLIGGDPAEHNGLSRALFAQFGTALHYVAEAEEGALEAARTNLVEELRASGRTVYVMPPGGSTEVGTLGYVRVFEQIVRFSTAIGVHFDRIVLPTGSAGTQAGLVVGQCISGYPTNVIGMAISRRADEQVELVRGLATSTARMLGVAFDAHTVLVDDRFLGDGYPIPSEQGREAVRLFAQLEGVQFDQVYVGKAGAGVIAAANEIEEHETTLLVHTGGNGGLYY